ncbi:hypothetical protein ACTHGU_02010 [Chitinophagaceae bacterium MMS25-I14]
MEDVFQITWRNAPIGTYHITDVDMGYFEGTWSGNSSAAAEAFGILVSAFNEKDVMQNPVKGTRILLHADGSDKFMHVLVISLTEEILFTRLVYADEAARWLVDNVQ